MATGFKVADAYVEVHTDDDTKRGRDKIRRDTEKWSKDTGDSMGRNILRGVLRGIAGIGRALFQLTFLSAKFTVMALAVGAVTTAVAGLLGYIVQLLPVVANLAQVAVTAAGSLLLIPGAIATLLTTILTLKLGLQGVGAALKAGLSGDVEALNQALQKLAPNAAATVQEIIKLKPAFDRMRLQIQNSLFFELAETLRRIAETYLPIVTKGLDAMAVVLNKTFRGVAEFLLGAGTQSDTAQILASIARAADNLRQVLIPVLQILRDVLVVSTSAFAELSSKLLPIVQGWADTVNRMREDGSLAKLITDGLDALRLFAGLAVDLLGILKGIFGAAGTSNGGLFQFFDRLNKLINSAQGQANLVAIFDALASAADALTPVLIVLLQALVPVLQGISQIAVAFGPGLQVVAEKLGEALVLLVPGFEALAPILPVIADALRPLAEILVGIVVGAAPYLLILFQDLATLLRELAPVAEPVGQALGLIVAIFADMIVLFGPLIADGLGLLAQVLNAILVPLEPLVRALLPLMARLFDQIFVALAPVIPVLAQFMAAFVVEILKHKDEILVLFQTWAILLTTIAEKMSGEFVQALTDIIPMLPDLVKNAFDLAIALTQLAIVLTPLITLMLNVPTPALKMGIEVLTGWLYLLAAAVEATIQVIQNWIMFFYGLYVQVRHVIDIIIEWVDNIRRGWDIVNGVFRAGIAYIGDAVSNFGSMLWGAGYNLIVGLTNGIRAAIPHLSGVMGWIADMVRAYWPFSPAKIGPLSGRGDMKIAGANLVGRLVEGVRQKMGTAGAAAGDLAGLFGVGQAGSLAFAGPGSGIRDIYVMAQIGDRPVREMVRGEITDNPQMVASATNEGNRQGVSLSGRKRIGDE